MDDDLIAERLNGEERDGVIARYVRGASTNAEFLDRWRPLGETSPRFWEERFGDVEYGGGRS